MKYKTWLYSATDAEITTYAVDAAACKLTKAKGGSITALERVQYLWPSPDGRTVYVGTSNVGPYNKSTEPTHHLTAYRVDPDSGALSQLGEARALKQRPVHLTLDQPGRHVIVAYPHPELVTVHRILADGSLGDEVPQQAGLDFGIYVHQVRAMPSGKTVIVAARGNNGAGDKPEDPGALKIMDFKDGRLANRASVAPKNGYGFGVRHIDFDPKGRWLYAGLERQNELHVFGLNGDEVRPWPLYMHTTLSRARSAPYQLVGTTHVHPNGKTVYVANRASGEKGAKLFEGGENTLAVYSINQKTGEPTLVQNAETRGTHARCFHIDPSGRMLVAANMTRMPTRTSKKGAPASLAVFRIAANGKLKFVRKYDVDVKGGNIFWMGMVKTQVGK